MFPTLARLGDHVRGPRQAFLQKCRRFGNAPIRSLILHSWEMRSPTDIPGTQNWGPSHSPWRREQELPRSQIERSFVPCSCAQHLQSFVSTTLRPIVRVQPALQSYEARESKNDKSPTSLNSAVSSSRASIVRSILYGRTEANDSASQQNLDATKPTSGHVYEADCVSWHQLWLTESTL